MKKQALDIQWFQNRLDEIINDNRMAFCRAFKAVVGWSLPDIKGFYDEVKAHKYFEGEYPSIGEFIDMFYESHAIHVRRGWISSKPFWLVQANRSGYNNRHYGDAHVAEYCDFYLKSKIMTHDETDHPFFNARLDVSCLKNRTRPVALEITDMDNGRSLFIYLDQEQTRRLYWALKKVVEED